MSELDVHQAVKLAMDTYPDLLNNPVAKAGFIYANEKEQAAYVIEKLLIKLKCHKNEAGDKPEPSKSNAPTVEMVRKQILENDNRIRAISDKMNTFQEAIIETQCALIDLQNKKIEKQKEMIEVYKKSEDNLYALLKEYMPVEDYEALVTGEET